jgi:hypothetical protein
LLGAQALLGAEAAHLGDQPLHGGDLLLGARVGPARVRCRPRRHHDGLATGENGPELLGDEGGDRVQEPQQHVQDVPQHGAGGLGLRTAPGERHLGELDVPVADLIPGEVVEHVAELRELEVLVARVDLGDGGVQAGEDPAVRGGELLARRHGCSGGRAVHQGEAGRVPQLVAEVARALHPLLADRHVGPRVGAAGKRKPGRVGAVGLDPEQRVDNVASGLRHLLAELVAHHAVQHDDLERLDSVHGVETEHHHPGDPEEQDVVAGHEHAGGIEALELAGLLRPAEGGERPQRRGEPRVQHVRVLAPAFAGMLVVGADADQLAVGAIPDRDPVAPPQLPTDAPVVHVVDPAEVPRLHRVGVDADPAVADGVPSGLGQRTHADEPLQRQPRLDDGVAARAVPDGMDVRALLGHDATLFPQCGGHGRPRLEPVEPLERAMCGDHTRLVEHHNRRQVVAAADLEVVRVVRRGHLHCPGAERRVDVLVGHDGDPSPGQRQLHLGADEVGVALVVRVHGDGRVAEHGLDPGRGHDDRRVALAVAQGHELTLVVGVLDLDVGQRRATARAPVDDPLGTVDEPVVVQPLEDRQDRTREPLVHGEALAAPVDAVPEPPHLVKDLPAVLVLPGPHALDEGIPTQVVAGLALVGELALDDVLGGDAGVVHAGLPQHLVALHPPTPGQCIHERVLEGVPDREHAGDVGRGDDDAVRRLVAAGVRLEVAALDPPLVELALYLHRGVLGREVDGRWGSRCGLPGRAGLRRGCGHPPESRDARGYVSPRLPPRPAAAFVGGAAHSPRRPLAALAGRTRSRSGDREPATARTRSRDQHSRRAARRPAR